MENEDIKEFGLVIIESLRDNDKPTGTILFEETITYKKIAEKNLSSYLHKVKTKQELFKLLDDIALKVEKEKFFPILHIETHGYDDGIQLNSNETVLWSELIPIFRKINISLANSLLILMSMCKGASVISFIDPLKRSPFKAIIGTAKKIKERDLLIAYQSFYENYFFSFDPVLAVENMNKELNANQNTFHLLIDEKCFDALVNPDRDAKFFSSLVNKHAINEKETNLLFKNIPLNEVKKIMDKRIRGKLNAAKENKGYFLMNDLRK